MKRLLDLAFGTPLPLLAAGFLLSAFITLAAENQLRSGFSGASSPEIIAPSPEAPDSPPPTDNTSTVAAVETIEEAAEEVEEDSDISLKEKPYDYEDVDLGDAYLIPLKKSDGTLIAHLPLTVIETNLFNFGNPLPIPHSDFYLPVPPELLADEKFVEQLAAILSGSTPPATAQAQADAIDALVLTTEGERGPCINLTWSGNTSNIWDIGTTSNWINTDNMPNTPDVYMDTDNTTFEDTGANTSIILASNVVPGNIIFNNTAADYVITGNTGTETITTSNPFTLSVNGGGNVTLNTLLSGNFTTVLDASSDAAELRLNGENISPFEAPENDGEVDFAAIAANNTLYTGGITLNRGRLLPGNDLALGTGNITIDHNVGSAELVLQDGITLYNDIYIADGGSGTEMSIELASGEATIAGPIAINESTQGDFALEAATNATLTVSGNISGQSLSLNSTVGGNTGGTVALSGTNTHTHTILNDGVTLRAGSDNAIGNALTMNNYSTLQLSDNAVLTASNGITIADGGAGEIKTIQLNDPNATAATISADITIQEDTNANVVFSVDTGHELTIAGVISGNGDGGFQKNGEGTLILTGDSTYTGDTVHNMGTLIIAGDNLGATGDFIVADGAILGGEGRIGGDITFGNTTGATLLVDAGTTGALRFAGTLDLTGGNHTIVIERMPEDPGTGIIILAQYNNLVGDVSDLNLDVNIPVSARLGGGSPLRDLGNLLVLDLAIQQRTWSGTDPTNPTFWDNGITPNWGGLTWLEGDSAIFDAAASYTVELQGNQGASKVTFKNDVGNDYTINGANGTEVLTALGDDGFDFENDGNVEINISLAGDAGLLKTGGGTVALNRDSTYSRGTVIEDGSIVVDSNMALGTGDVTLKGGELALASSGLDVPNNIEIDGNGVTISLAVSGSSSLSGDVNLRGGGKGKGGKVFLNAATDSRMTFSGVIGPDKESGTIELIGNGTVVFTGANTYNGDTDITSGTLLINGDQSGSTSKIDADEGAFLGGIGIHGGKTHLHGDGTDGGTMTPGDPTINMGVGEYTGNDEFLFESGSSYAWQLIANNDDEARRGLDYDTVTQTDGKLKLQNDTTFEIDVSQGVNFTDAFWLSDREWLVLDYNDGDEDIENGFFEFLDPNPMDQFGNTPTDVGGSFSILDDATGLYAPVGGINGDVDNIQGIYLVWTAVPEPGTYSLMALALTGFGWYARRRRKQKDS